MGLLLVSYSFIFCSWVLAGGWTELDSWRGIGRGETREGFILREEKDRRGGGEVERELIPEVRLSCSLAPPINYFCFDV